MPHPSLAHGRAPRLLRAGRALLAVVAVASACARGEGGSAEAATRATSSGETAAPDSTALRASADTGRILGQSSAKVWLVVVSDFQCPYCKMWHDETYEALRREYVETGKVRMAYVHFPLEQHRQAGPAAEAAMCAAAQGRFWPYQSALFTTVERWGRGGAPQAVFDSLATVVGVDRSAFRRCVDSGVMRAVVAADFDRAVQAGVRSTPSFIIGRTIVSGAQPVEVFRRAIDAELRQRSGA